MNNTSFGTGPGNPGAGGFVLGLLTGMVIGGAAVMLYAPKSGAETRAQLKDEFNKIQQMLQGWANDIRARADEFNQIIKCRTEETAGGRQRREF